LATVLPLLPVMATTVPRNRLRWYVARRWSAATESGHRTNPGGIDVGVGQECADAASVQAADEGMSVVVVAPYRNEQRCGRIVWVSAVGDDAFDPAVPARQRTSGYRSDLL